MSKEKNIHRPLYLYGYNSVGERLRAAPESIRRIYLLRNSKQPGLNKEIERLNIPLTVCPAAKMAKMVSSVRRLDIIAEIEPYRYASSDDILADVSATTILFLDEIQDPVNLGAILRICACLGNFSLCISKHGAVSVSETVLHIAQGAENYVTVGRGNIAAVIRQAKDAGYWIGGAVARGGENMYEKEVIFPFGLVLGAEGRGIRPGVEQLLDFKISIPMPGAPLSLNVAMSAAMFCYEINKQRNSR